MTESLTQMICACGSCLPSECPSQQASASFQEGKIPGKLFISSQAEAGKTSELLLFFDRRRSCSSSDSGVVWNDTGHSLTLAHNPTEQLTIALLADRGAWLLLTCWGVSKQTQQQGKSDAETLPCWRNPHWLLCAQRAALNVAVSW